MGTTYWLVLKPGTTNTSDEWNLTSPPILGTVAFSPDDSMWTWHPPVDGFIYSQDNLWCTPAPGPRSTSLLMLETVATPFGLHRTFSRQQSYGQTESVTARPSSA